MGKLGSNSGKYGEEWLERWVGMVGKVGRNSGKGAEE